MWAFWDSFFLYFHLGLTVFNLTGWIWPKTRTIHFIVTSLTLASWLGLGIFYGIGYCPLTDLHWRVREKLGYTDMPASYIKFLVDYFTGWDVNAQLVDHAAAVSMAVVFGVSLYLQVKQRWLKSTKAN